MTYVPGSASQDIAGISDMAVPDTGTDHSEPFWKRMLNFQSVWILGVLIVIVAFFAVMAGGKFFSASNFSTISQNVSILAVIGVGMTFVIVTSGIDLSVGSVLIFSSVISAKVMLAVGGDNVWVIIVGLLAAVATGTVWGLLNGYLVAIARVPPLIVTLGTLSLALALAQVITGALDVGVNATRLTDIGQYGKILGIPAISFIALVVVIIGGVCLHRTKFGLYTFAIGSSEEAAKRVGVKTRRHLIAVYSLSGFLAGLGAIMYLSQFGTTSIGGLSLLNLNAISAVVIGGTSIFGGQGSMFGTVVGLFIPAVLAAGFIIIGVSPYWQGAALGAVLIAAVYVDQTRRAAAQRGSKK
jgi:ribose transport system permease protein